jgi:hypothetical protein
MAQGLLPGLTPPPLQFGTPVALSLSVMAMGVTTDSEWSTLTAKQSPLLRELGNVAEVMALAQLPAFARHVALHWMLHSQPCMCQSCMDIA